MFPECGAKKSPKIPSATAGAVTAGGPAQTPVGPDKPSGDDAIESLRESQQELVKHGKRTAEATEKAAHELSKPDLIGPAALKWAKIAGIAAIAAVLEALYPPLHDFVLSPKEPATEPVKLEETPVLALPGGRILIEDAHIPLWFFEAVDGSDRGDRRRKRLSGG